jgi:hypothetical protein
MITAAATGAWSAFPALGGRAEPVPVSAAPTVVADTRFAASRAFSAEAGRSGSRIAWIDGDITNLWYDELDLLWRREPAVIAGLTAYGAFFCLERLGMDRGLRLVFKRQHQGSLFRWMLAPKRQGGSA